MIVGVAIKVETVDGHHIFWMPAPNRHHNLFWKFEEVRGTELDAQGFVDEAGNFYSREDAEAHARNCGQLKVPCIGSVLTSEDLW